MTTGADIVRTAREWIGVPYRHQGRDRSGVDCGGFVIAIALQLGLDKASGYVDHADYPRRPSDTTMMALMRKHMTTHRGQLEPGLVLHFSFVSLPYHAAIYTGDDNHIIHAYDSGRKQVIETTYSGKWPKRLHGIYRYKGLE